MRKSALIGGCLVSVVLFLAACGGGESEEDKVVGMIETSATTTDPSACTEFATENFNEQTSGKEGEAALKDCEENAPQDSAESADVSNVKIDGSSATADVALTGGSLDGQTLAVSVVKEGDQWKMDELTGFVELDRPKLVETLEEKMGEEHGIPKSVVTCIGEGVEESSQAELEDLFFGGSVKGFVELAEDCST